MRTGRTSPSSTTSTPTPTTSTDPEWQGKWGGKDKVSPLLRKWKTPGRKWEGEELVGFVDAYDDCLSFLDHHFGLMMDELEQRGALDNTVVIIVGDHGDLFGEHGLYDHGISLHRPLVQVPLIVSYPGTVPENKRIAQVVSLRDLAATILDLTGVEPEQPFPGTSLAPLWRGEPLDNRSPAICEIHKGVNLLPHLPVAKGDLYSIFEGGMQYILRSDGEEELYATDVDPMEEQNLMESEAATAAELRTRLGELIPAVGTLPAPPEPK